MLGEFIVIICFFFGCCCVKEVVDRREISVVFMVIVFREKFGDIFVFVFLYIKLS